MLDETGLTGSLPARAPWDTVLNDTDNFPGGDPPPDGEEIAATCRALGHDRFDMAVASGSAAVVVALLATALAWRRAKAHAHSSA